MRTCLHLKTIMKRLEWIVLREGEGEEYQPSAANLHYIFLRLSYFCCPVKLSILALTCQQK